MQLTVKVLEQLGELTGKAVKEHFAKEIGSRDARIAQLEADVRTLQAMISKTIEAPR